MTTVAVIPARYASTRFPGKALARQTGKYLIQHVYERVQVAPLIQDLCVATDDERIADAVRSFGGRVVMTRPDHVSGTDRIAEAVRDMPCDIVVNVQGDEPEIEPFTISQLVELLQDRTDCEMATLACPFRFVPEADPHSPDAVKVQIDGQHRAVDFSRRLLLAPPGSRFEDDPHPLLHLGIYAYRKDFLMEFSGLPPTPLERERRLEQMRALENGRRIAVGLVRSASVGIDTPAEYEAFVRRQAGRIT